MNKKTFTAFSCAAALAGAVSTVAVMQPTDALAGVKCYGIAKAGENDCANAAKTHSCAGQSKVSYSGDDWKTAKTAEKCTAMGGDTKPFEGFNKKMKS